ALAIENFGPSQMIELQARKPEGQDLRQYAGDDDRNRRASGDVDDRFVLDDVRDGDGAGGVWIGVGNSAERSAAANRDDGHRTLGSFLEHVDIAHAADG